MLSDWKGWGDPALGDAQGQEDAVGASTDDEQLIFVAGDGPHPDGYVASFVGNSRDGWTERDRCAGLRGALAMTQHPYLDRLYVATSDVEAGHAGRVAVLDSRNLRLISTHPSGGRLPCSLSVDPSGRVLIVVNYLDGELVAFGLTTDGDLGEVTDHRVHPGQGPVLDRQEQSHVHQATFDLHNKHLLVTDLGADRIYTYVVDPETGSLLPAATPVTYVAPGSGPRHIAFANPELLITTDELSSTLSWYDYDPGSGGLTWRGSTPTITDSAGENYPSELVVTNAGTVCVAGNRGRDTVAIFAIGEDGLRRIAEIATGGHWPQHLAVVDGTVWCALRDSDRIRMLRVDEVDQGQFLDQDLKLPRPNWITVSAR